MPSVDEKCYICKYFLENFRYESQREKDNALDSRRSSGVRLSDGHRMTVDFYAPDIFRLFRDDNGGIVRNPEADPHADILVQNPRRGVYYTVEETAGSWNLSTGVISVSFDKEDGTMSVKDLRSGGSGGPRCRDRQPCT